MTILQETTSKWGNGYQLRYYLDGQRISQEEATRLFETSEPEQISNERVSEISGWRSRWKL